MCKIEQLHPVGLEPLQTLFRRKRNVSAREAFRVDVGAGRVETFGGDHHVVAVPLDQAAEHLLGPPAAVLVCRVEEVDARVTTVPGTSPLTRSRPPRCRMTSCRNRAATPAHQSVPMV